MNVIAADGASRDLLGTSRRNVRENVIVDRNSRSAIAAAEAGDITNLQVFRTRIGKAAFQISAQFASAVEVAAQVRADTNLRLRRRHEMQVRIKTRDAVNL